MKQKQIKIFPDDKPDFKSIRDQIDTLTGNSNIKLGLRVGFVTIGLGFLSLALGFRHLPPEVPLLYSRPYGETQLMSVWGLWLLPGVSLLVELISVQGAGKIIETDKLLANILVWTGSLVSFMALISQIKIMILVW